VFEISEVAPQVHVFPFRIGTDGTRPPQTKAAAFKEPETVDAFRIEHGTEIRQSAVTTLVVGDPIEELPVISLRKIGADTDIVLTDEIDDIVDRREMRNYIIRLLNFMMNPEIHGESDIERARRRAISRK